MEFCQQPQKLKRGSQASEEPTVPADILITVFWDPEQTANFNHAQIPDSETVEILDLYDPRS